jgi:hypothetical protein
VASGVSVSLPRFYEGGATPPSRDSHRARKAEQARSGSDEDGSPRRRPPRPSRDDRQPRPSGDSNRGRPPRPRPAAEQSHSPAKDGEGPPRRRPPLRPLGQPLTNHPQAEPSRGRAPRPRPTTAASRNIPPSSSQPPLDRKKRAGAPPPPESVGPQRRIIGMEPDPPVEAGRTITGKRKPKRPAVRKRPPPGGGLAKKPGSSPDAGIPEAGDE